MRTRLLTSVLTAATAVMGALGTDPDSDWYRALEKPPWQPPAPAFGIVWTPLYVGIAYGTGRLIEATPPEHRARTTALVVADLAANAGWNWAFFRGRSPAGGLVVIGALNALNLALLAEASRRDGRATAALAPYAAWTGFATALNGSIWARNRRGRGPAVVR